MTSELTSEAPRAESESTPPAPGGGDRSDSISRLYVRISLAFLALGAALVGVAEARLVFPDTLSDVAFLAYGRLFPVAVNLFIYGWLTLGLIGAGFFVLPRVSGKGLRHPRLAEAGAGLLTVGILAGAVGVGAGLSEGRRFLEFPLWADAVILLGLLAVVRVFTSTIARSSPDSLAPSEWFFGAAPVWLLLSHVVGNVPGFVGVNSVLQTTFFRGALFGLWLAGAGAGVVYYLVSAITGREPRRVTQLAVAAFWSFAFVFALSAASRLTYRTAPDWVETIGGLFSIALFLPVAIILVDVATALREGDVKKDGEFKFLVAGLVALALVPVVNVALSLRGSNAVVGMTDWATALDVLIVFGVFSFWLFAFVHHRALPSGSGRAHFGVSVAAVATAVGTMLVTGLQAGLTWLAAANSGEVSAGEGFEATVGGMEGHHWVRLIAFAAFALAQAWLLLAGWRARTVPEPEESFPRKEPSEPSPDELAATAGPDASEVPADEDPDEETEGVGSLPAGTPVSRAKVRTGTLGIFVIVALFLFGFPALEKEHTAATALADNVRRYGTDSVVAEGRAVYLDEGCWYCHTQEVRGIVTDVRLGPVAQPGDYAHETPSAAGLVRVGPDLMFAGSREPTSSAGWVREFLQDPRAVRAWSTMPAHDYLGSADLDAVAAYVSSLRPFEFE